MYESKEYNDEIEKYFEELYGPILWCQELYFSELTKASYNEVSNKEFAWHFRTQDLDVSRVRTLQIGEKDKSNIDKYFVEKLRQRSGKDLKFTDVDFAKGIITLYKQKKIEIASLLICIHEISNVHCINMREECNGNQKLSQKFKKELLCNKERDLEQKISCLEHIKVANDSVNLENKYTRFLKADRSRSNIQLRGSEHKDFKYLGRQDEVHDDESVEFMPKRFTTRRRLLRCIYRNRYWELFDDEYQRRQMLDSIDYVFGDNSNFSNEKIIVGDFKNYFLQSPAITQIQKHQMVALCLAIDLWVLERNESDDELSNYYIKQKLSREKKLNTEYERILLHDKLSDKTEEEFTDYMWRNLHEYCCDNIEKEDFREYVIENGTKQLNQRNLTKRINLWNYAVVGNSGGADSQEIEKRLDEVSKKIDHKIAIKALRECCEKNPYKIKLDDSNIVPDENVCISDIAQYVTIQSIVPHVTIPGSDLSVRDSMTNVIVSRKEQMLELKDEKENAIREILECLYYMGKRSFDFRKNQKLSKTFIGKNGKKKTVLNNEGKRRFQEAIENDYLKKKLKYVEYSQRVCAEILKKPEKDFVDFVEILKYMGKCWKLKLNFREYIYNIDNELCERLENDVWLKNYVRQVLEEYIYRKDTNSILDQTVDASTLLYAAEQSDDVTAIIKAEVFLEDVKRVLYTDIELDFYINRGRLPFVSEDRKSLQKELFFDLHLNKKSYVDFKSEVKVVLEELEVYYRFGRYQELYDGIYKLYKSEQKSCFIMINKMFLQKIKGYCKVEKWQYAAELQAVFTRQYFYESIATKEVNNHKEIINNLNEYFYSGIDEKYIEFWEADVTMLEVWFQLMNTYKWDTVFKKIEESEKNFQIYVECYNLIRNHIDS